jgi:hypothetical protein
MRSPKVMPAFRLRQVSWCRPALLRSWVPAGRLLAILLVRRLLVWRLLAVCAWNWGRGAVLVLVLAIGRLLWRRWWVLLLLLGVVACVLWRSAVGGLLLLAAAVFVIAAIFVVAAVFVVVALGAV